MTEPSLPAQGPGVESEQAEASLLEDEPELLARLGDRSPHEVYGPSDEPPEDEGDEPEDAPEPTGARRSERSSAGTRAERGTRGAAQRRGGASGSGPAVGDGDGDPEGSAEATRAGPPVKVEIVGGPDEGGSRRFVGVRMVVGRVKGCDLVLSDQSVSRRHLELVVGENGVLLRDLGSGNGTKVNNERATERLIEHGDVISLGQTKLRFVDEAEERRRARDAALKAEEEARAAEEQAKAGAQAAQAAEAQGRPPAERPRRRPGRWGLGGGALLLLSALWLLVHHLRSTGGRGPPAGLSERERAQVESALAEGRLSDAQALLASLQRRDPSWDAQPIMRRLLVDKKAKVSLDIAEGLLAQGRFDDARAELARTPEADASFKARQKALVAQVDKRQAEQLLRSFEEGVSQRDFAKAEAALVGLPADMRPELGARLAREKQRAAAESAQDARTREAQKRKEKALEAERRRQLVAEVFSTVSHRLDEQDFTRAALECDRLAERYREDAELREKALRVKGQVPVLSRNLKDGQAKLDLGALDGAVRPLKLAHDVYYTYMGMSGELGRSVDRLLATALLGAGKLEEERGAPGAAERDYRDVVRFAPGSEQAQSAQGALDKLESDAEALLTEALELKAQDPRRCAVKLKQVLGATDAASRVHKRAQAALVTLAGGF